MLFVDGFEDTEAIATLDVLKRGGFEVITASLMNREVINPKYTKTVTADALIEDIDYKLFDGLVILVDQVALKLCLTYQLLKN